MSEREPQTGAPVWVETVEWLPTGTDTGLLRVRGGAAASRPAGPPALVISGANGEHRRASLPEPPGAGGATWRGAYVVAAQLLSPPPQGLWVEWEDGLRVDVPLPAGIEPPPAAAEERGGEVVDRAVLAERRARRAEAAEQAQARAAREALDAVEALERRGRELEERLEDALRDRDVLQERVARLEQAPPTPVEDPAASERLAAALDAVARHRAEAVRLRVALRVSETGRAASAVRLTADAGARDELARLAARLERAEALAAERGTELVALRADLQSVRLGAAAGDVALADARARLAALAAELQESRRRSGRLEGEVADARAAFDEARERLRREAEARAAAVERTLAAAARAQTPAEPPPNRPGPTTPRPPVPVGLADRARALAASTSPAPGASGQVTADLEAAALRLKAPSTPPAAAPAPVEGATTVPAPVEGATTAPAPVEGATTAPAAPRRRRPRGPALARLERWLRRHTTSG